MREGMSVIKVGHAVLIEAASDRLAVVETTSYDAQRKAEKDKNAFRSDIYAPGAEFMLVHAQAQVMSAVVGILTESISEALKGFYKIRKAFAALKALAEMEKAYLRSEKSRPSSTATQESYPASIQATRSVDSGISSRGQSSTADTSEWTHIERDNEEDDNDDDDDEDDEFHDADEHIDDSPDVEKSLKRGTTHKHTVSQISMPPLTRGDTLFPSDPLGAIRHPVDEYIHSGSLMTHGCLLLLLSMVPPSFGRILSVIGFRGDRDRGLTMLWKTTKYDNINGGMASLVVLSFYSTLMTALDILPPTPQNLLRDTTPDQEVPVGVHPRAACRTLLARMRKMFPKSRVWLLEESRAYSSDRRLDLAVQTVNPPIDDDPSALKQVRGLSWFQYSINCMYMHHYTACATAFQKCVSLNSWSHVLYYYIPACCHVELYRTHKYGLGRTPSESVPIDEKQAAVHAAAAVELFEKATSNTGKKKFMQRQMPFDIFVARKMNKWRARAAERGVPLVDAVGVSPVEELNFFWSGYARMSREELVESLVRLAWSDGLVEERHVEEGQTSTSDNQFWQTESRDERAVLAVLRACVWRHLGRTKEAAELLKREVIDGHSLESFKGLNKDSWTAPLARYELAVCYWVECPPGRQSVIEQHGLDARELPEESDDDDDAIAEKLKQCASLLDKVSKWESYDLETRWGMRVSTAKQAVASYT